MMNPTDGDLDDRDLPDPSDMDQDDYTVMSRCPHCKKMIDEQSEVCPRCGMYLSVEDEPKKFPLWVIIVMLAAMLAMVITWFG